MVEGVLQTPSMFQTCFSDAFSQKTEHITTEPNLSSMCHFFAVGKNGCSLGQKKTLWKSMLQTPLTRQNPHNTIPLSRVATLWLFASAMALVWVPNSIRFFRHSSPTTKVLGNPAIGISWSCFLWTIYPIYSNFCCLPITNGW